MARMNQFRSEGADKYPTTRAVTLRNMILFYCHSVKKPNLKTRDHGPSLESFMHYHMTCGILYHSWDVKTECRTVMNVHTVFPFIFCCPYISSQIHVNTFAASYLNTQGFNNSFFKSPASTLVDLTFQSRVLRSFSLNQLRNLSL